MVLEFQGRFILSNMELKNSSQLSEDPSKLRKEIESLMKIFFEILADSFHLFSDGARNFFVILYQHLQQIPDCNTYAIFGNIFFLRVLCPMLVAPEAYHLPKTRMEHQPLMLHFVKTLQMMANGTTFDAHHKLAIVNDDLPRYQKGAKDFYNSIVGAQKILVGVTARQQFDLMAASFTFLENFFLVQEEKFTTLMEEKVQKYNKEKEKKEKAEAILDMQLKFIAMVTELKKPTQKTRVITLKSHQASTGPVNNGLNSSGNEVSVLVSSPSDQQSNSNSNTNGDTTNTNTHTNTSIKTCSSVNADDTEADFVDTSAEVESDAGSCSEALRNGYKSRASSSPILSSPPNHKKKSSTK
eukprot:TRINITY_DN11740_c0_g1_i1.p1 TRINITY_DN11740_c0_g1~~TRINITY_DN11740_c0_g1_i1.p1  ORF type:complete len:355 (+),score=91.90 TRINITY_DN11740_c0_g1_i1:1048-2112(+)